jgi:uncharacterized protein (TIGR02147 family)
MLQLEDVSDYRELLRQYYQQRKEAMPLYSYRMMGQKLGLDASQLFRILQKEQHLPPRCVPLTKELLELTGRSAEYFDLLVAASRTRVPSKRSELLEKAFMLRDVDRRTVENKELRFLSQWYIPVVRSYLEVSGGKANPSEIAERVSPRITQEQAAEALDLLKELGFVKRLSSGRLGLTQTHLTASGPEKAKAVREFQRQALNLGINALDAIPVGERDISTLTLAIDSDCFNDLREMTREFRRQVQKRVEESTSPDRVMQMTMTFYPLVQAKAGEE